jgi:hypothetical protein
MIEFIRHAFGFCGEHWHPNIFTILISGLGLSTPFYYIIVKLKSYRNESKSRSTSKFTRR